MNKIVYWTVGLVCLAVVLVFFSVKVFTHLSNSNTIIDGAPSTIPKPITPIQTPLSNTVAIKAVDGSTILTKDFRKDPTGNARAFYISGSES